MTATQIELINSPEFWRRRIIEQENYIYQVNLSNRDHARKADLIFSAVDMLEICLEYQRVRLKLPKLTVCINLSPIYGFTITYSKA